jgi:hypothetical protein
MKRCKEHRLTARELNALVTEHRLHLVHALDRMGDADRARVERLVDYVGTFALTASSAADASAESLVCVLVMNSPVRLEVEKKLIDQFVRVPMAQIEAAHGFIDQLR